MGNIMQKLWKKQDIRIIMQGLDAAGKTTLLYKLKLGEVVTTIPTIGFNVETVTYKNVNFTCWDIGGRDKMRPLRRHYYQNTQAIIFVIDSNDRERFTEAKEELDSMLADDELRDVVLVVLANKQDLPRAASAQEVTEALQLHKIKQPCCIFPTMGNTGLNLYEALEWMMIAIKQRDEHPPTVTHAVLQANTTAESYVAKSWEMLKKLFTASPA